MSGEAWAKKVTHRAAHDSNASSTRGRDSLQDEHGHTIHDPRALDPREAIIAHAEAAKKNPFYTSVRPLAQRTLNLCP